MKKVIRVGVFETNSSSSHSLSYVPGYEVLGRKERMQEVDVILTGGQYSWGSKRVTRLKTWGEKADYFAVGTYGDPKKKQMLEDAIKMQYPNANVIFKVKWTPDAIRGNRKDWIQQSEIGDYGDDNISWIDHESEHGCWNSIDSVEKLHEVLFGRSTIDMRYI